MRPFRLPAGRRRRPAIIATFGGTCAAVVLAIVAAAMLQGGAPAAQIALATPSPTPSPAVSPSPSPTPLPSVATPSPAPSPAPDALLGSDGRFTILLLGSDYRPAHPGNRTDTIMVVSVDPKSGAVAAASIPRDTVNVPLPDGGVFRGRVNALYQSLIARLGRTAAGAEMKRTIGNALQLEIDSYAVVGFAGVRRLVDAVGGVDVKLAKAYHDPYYWVTAHKQGVTFPAGTNHLNGERALIFARTRKGDNDFERARRQQLLVAGAMAAVRERGLERLPALIAAGRSVVQTDLALTSGPEIYAIVTKAHLADAARVVFGPRTWAKAVGSTTFSLRLVEVRAWVKKWMPPLVPPPAVSAALVTSATPVASAADSPAP
jgi:LCP family protein required for cell wall assembly